MRATPSGWKTWLPILLFAASSAADASDGQGWFSNSLTVKAGDHWRIKATRELRTREVAYEDTFLWNWSLGVVRRLPKSFYVGLAYKEETEEKTLLTSHERRVQIEGGWARKLGSASRFDLRLRSEIRDFEEPSVEDHSRLRLRLRLRRKAQLGKLALEPFVSTELFQSSATDVVVFRNRFAAGTSMALRRQVRLVVNYLRQDSRGRAPLHVLNTGFDLSF